MSTGKGWISALKSFPRSVYEVFTTTSATHQSPVKRQALDLTQVMTVTPCSIQCALCNKNTGWGRDAIHNHVSKCEECVKANVKLSWSDARQIANTAKQQRLTSDMECFTGFCCDSCGHKGKLKANVLRHCKKHMCASDSVRKVKLCRLLNGKVTVDPYGHESNNGYEQQAEMVLFPDCYTKCEKAVHAAIDYVPPEQRESIYGERIKSHKRTHSKGKRQYIPGALFDQFLESNPAVIDVRGEGTRVLHIKLADDTVTQVIIKDTSENKRLLDAVVDLGKAADNHNDFKGGHVRKTKKLGDYGKMFSLGWNRKYNTLFKPCRDTPDGLAVFECLKKIGPLVSKWMLKEFPFEMADIAVKEKQTKHPFRRLMECIMVFFGSVMFLSINLGNACHLDVKDLTRSVAIWAADEPEDVDNWYFILPYVTNGTKKGVAIKLFHGCSISWDGRVLFHCTSVTKTREDKNVYACMVGVSKNNAE